jgi:hypothetical protein
MELISKTPVGMSSLNILKEVVRVADEMANEFDGTIEKYRETKIEHERFSYFVTISGVWLGGELIEPPQVHIMKMKNYDDMSMYPVRPYDFSTSQRDYLVMKGYAMNGVSASRGVE